MEVFNSMGPRERLLTCLTHKEPDKVPLDLGGSTTTIETIAYNNLKRYLNINKVTRNFLRDHVLPDEEILKLFNIDTRYLHPQPPKGWKRKYEKGKSSVDEWGITWEKPESSLYYEPVGHPLENATIDDLDRYNWPNTSDPGRVEGLNEKAKYLYEKTNYAIIADMHGLGVFETSWMLRGFAKFLEDLLINKEFAWTLLEIVTDLKIQLYHQYLKSVGKYIQVVMTADDVSMENSLIISPELYREMIKPFHKKLWHSIKNDTYAYLFLHSCGSVYELITDFIDLGVDILNPVQTTAKNMEPKKLKEQFGDKISFWGGIDTRYILPNGTMKEIEEEVRHKIQELAPGGGYVLCAVHNIQADVRAENIVKMYNCANKYGVYGT